MAARKAARWYRAAGATGGRLAAEYVNGALSKEYIDLGGRLLAWERPDGTTTYLTQDHLGSTRVLTGAGGSVISRHDVEKAAVHAALTRCRIPAGRHHLRYFVARGPYRWVRHPLYFCLLVLFWSNPDLTADRLLLNILWTA